MSTNTRQKTLTRMRALVAASTAAVASMNCNNGCDGYGVVDPLPGPGPTPAGFCGGIAATFKVGVKSFDPNARRDAGGAADGGLLDLDGSTADDGGDAGFDAGVTDPPPAEKVQRTFFALTVRSGAGTGVSLKKATFSAVNAKVLGVRQSELTTEMDLDTTGLVGFSVRVVLDSRCGGGGGAATLLFDVAFGSDGEIAFIKGREESGFGGFGDEPLVNEL